MEPAWVALTERNLCRVQYHGVGGWERLDGTLRARLWRSERARAVLARVDR